MSDRYQSCFADAWAWAERAEAEGWIRAEARDGVLGVERALASDVFERGGERPMVAALFGGTGVGKSSLLNRLAGQRVSRVGVERPTSLGATVYAHRDAPLAALPATLASGRSEVVRHANPRWRNVVWIDAPDIDSLERPNRELTLSWLPHVDLVVYVMSPERYRDDVGWRLLAERRGRHGWIFVLNRWDEGEASQHEDLARRLGEEGFDQAMLFRTCSAEQASRPMPTSDELEALAEAVDGLARERAGEELERMARGLRLEELATALDRAATELAAGDAWDALRRSWAMRWRVCREEIESGMDWPIRAAGERFAAAQSGSATADLSPYAKAAWDHWSGERLSRSFDATEIEADRAGIPFAPLRKSLEAVLDSAAELVHAKALESLRSALARPGGALGRFARATLRVAAWAMPLAALGWVGATVVVGYHEAAGGRAAFLDSRFAIHSAMLVLVAWALPYGAGLALRPAMDRVVRSALGRGLGDGLESLGEALERAIEHAAAEAAAEGAKAEAIARSARAAAESPKLSVTLGRSVSKAKG